MGGCGSFPGRGKGCSLPHSVKIGLGPHPGSYAMSTGDLSPKREADYSHPSTAEVKSGGAITPFSLIA
jgi:hypothetical protein